MPRRAVSSAGRSASGLTQPLVEQPQQEFPVEALELIRPVLFLDSLEAVAEIVFVAVQKALLLDEVDEHQTVEHKGGVPVPIALRGEPVDELLKVGQFLLEAVIEALGDALDVQGLPELLGITSVMPRLPSSSSVNSMPRSRCSRAVPVWPLS